MGHLRSHGGERSSVRIPVFVSRPSPHLQAQQQFLSEFADALTARGFDPITMGRESSYDFDAPLVGIRRLLTHCCGLVSVAFRRTRATDVVKFPSADISGLVEQRQSGVWFTSPYCQIEPAMAFQLGLPVLILKEKGVVAEGVLEQGVTGLYLPEFQLTDGQSFIDSSECRSLFDQWGSSVRSVYKRRGDPPKLFD